MKVFADSKRVPLSRSLTEIKTFLSIKVIRYNAITQCASGNAWADVSRSSIRIPALRVTSDHAYGITLRHIRGTTLFLIREE